MTDFIQADSDHKQSPDQWMALPQAGIKGPGGFIFGIPKSLNSLKSLRLIEVSEPGPAWGERE